MQLLTDFERESAELITQAKQGDRVRMIAGAGALLPLAVGTLSNPVCLVGALLSGGAYMWQVLHESHASHQSPRLFPSFSGYGDRFLESAWGDSPAKAALAALYREIGKGPITLWLESLPEGVRSQRLHQLIEARASLNDDMADLETEEAESLYNQRMRGIKQVLGLAGGNPPPRATAALPAAPPALGPASALPSMDLKDLLQYPVILIFGPQGSGKTTLATWLLAERARVGHDIRVLDPHREYGQWQGFPVVGDGMNYSAINEAMIEFTSEVCHRYELRAITPNYRPAPVTILAEELTGWGDKCPYTPDFFRASLSDIRKIACHVVYVSHGRTLDVLGKAKGLGAVKDAALLEIELSTVTDPNGKATPSGVAKVYYPNRKDAPVTVAIPLSICLDVPAEPLPRNSAEPFSSNVQQAPATAPVVVDSPQGDWTEPEIPMIEGSPISYDASRILGYMTRRKLTRIKLRDLAAGKPLGKISHTSGVLQPPIAELLQVNLITIDRETNEIVLNC